MSDLKIEKIDPIFSAWWKSWVKENGPIDESAEPYYVAVWAFRNGFMAAESRAPQWVSVEDRMPKPYDLCLVAVCAPYSPNQTNTGYAAVVADKLHWRITDEAGNHADFVTHWMPLPSPPESSDE